MSSHRTNSSLCPLATFFSAPSGFEERKTAMTSVGSAGAGLGIHCKSIVSFAGTRHQTPTSNETIAIDGLFMGFLTSSHRQRAGHREYSIICAEQRLATNITFLSPQNAPVRYPLLGGQVAGANPAPVSGDFWSPRWTVMRLTRGLSFCWCPPCCVADQRSQPKGKRDVISSQ